MTDRANEKPLEHVPGPGYADVLRQDIGAAFDANDSDGLDRIAGRAEGAHLATGAGQYRRLASYATQCLEFLQHSEAAS
ncbi:hypothetical protein HKX42_00020 [Salinisphaera sp. USBA-960]|nr:hypothetical protein [Salifodinibacter halophilus]NNC25277.1 hypothetical protein [Salifodinibacter halophilus]